MSLGLLSLKLELVTLNLSLRNESPEDSMETSMMLHWKRELVQKNQLPHFCIRIDQRLASWKRRDDDPIALRIESIKGLRLSSYSIPKYNYQTLSALSGWGKSNRSNISEMIVLISVSFLLIQTHTSNLFWLLNTVTVFRLWLHKFPKGEDKCFYPKSKYRIYIWPTLQSLTELEKCES